MSLARDIFRGILWNHAGRILEYALMYLFSVFVARGLGAELNGTYVTFYTLAQLVLLVSGLGFETALTRSAAQISSDAAVKLRFLFRALIRWRIAALFIGAGFFFIFRTAIFDFLSLPSTALQYFYLLLLYVVLRGLVLLFLALFVAQFNTKTVSIVSVAARAFELGAVYSLLTHGYGIEAVLTVIIGGAALMLIGCLAFGRANYVGPAERVETRPVVTLGAIFWMNTIMAYVLEKQGDVLLLNNLLGDRREVAFYDVAYGFMQMVVYGFTVGFGGVSLAAFSRVAVSNPESLGPLWRLSAKIVALLLLPPLIFLGIHADAVIPRIYSHEYAGSVVLFQLLVLFQITARLFGSGVNADVLLATNRTKILVGFSVVAGVLNIVLDLLLIPQHRAAGAVIATGIANTAVMIMTAVYITQKFRVAVPVTFWLKVVAISLVSGLMGRYLFRTGEFLGVLFSGVLYLALWTILAYTLKLFSRSDIEVMKKINFQLSAWATHFALT
jgi:O-antigen/teichoic acid export membrane protein